jgi:hypothetical protein
MYFNGRHSSAAVAWQQNLKFNLYCHTISFSTSLNWKLIERDLTLQRHLLSPFTEPKNQTAR